MYYLDAASMFYDEIGNVDEEYVSGDGIHLNREGYQLLAEYLRTHTIPLEGED